MIKLFEKAADWLIDMFGSNSTITMAEHTSGSSTRFCVEDFAIQMAVNMIAGVISKCEFQTFSSGKPAKSSDYYLWNVEPNINQNANEFWRQVVSNLLYHNECLVVPLNGQWVIADNYSHDNSKAEFPDTFTNVTCRSLTFGKTFHMEEVLFFRLHNKDIRTLLSGLVSQYSSLMDMAVGKYKRSGGRKGVMSTKRTAAGGIDEIKKTNDYLQSAMTNYYNSENGMFTLPNGMEYTEITGEGSKKSASEISDISNLLKDAISLVAHAFHIPAALLQGDIADVSHLLNEFLTFCIDPICRMIETEMTRKLYGKSGFLAGWYIKIDTTCVQHVDIFEVAVQADKLISSGLYSIDELRQKISDTALNTWWSQKHWMTKNYAGVESVASASDSPGGGETE